MRKEIVCMAGSFAFAIIGYAAEPAEAPKPVPSSPTVGRESDAERADKPVAQASKPPARDIRFDPPPVPDFMLRRPEKPLTLEEMKRQADEAAERARRAREAGSAGAQTPNVGAETAGTKPDNPKP